MLDRAKLHRCSCRNLVEVSTQVLSAAGRSLEPRAASLLHRALLEQIAEVVAAHPRLLVLSDEIYEHIIYPPASHVSFGALPGLSRSLITASCMPEHHQHRAVTAVSTSDARGSRRGTMCQRLQQ